MARPRSTDPKQRLAVFIPSSVLARVTERAEAKGVSPGVLVGRMVVRAFTDEPRSLQRLVDLHAAFTPPPPAAPKAKCDHPHRVAGRCLTCGHTR